MVLILELAAPPGVPSTTGVGSPAVDTGRRMSQVCKRVLLPLPMK